MTFLDETGYAQALATLGAESPMAQPRDDLIRDLRTNACLQYSQALENLRLWINTNLTLAKVS